MEKNQIISKIKDIMNEVLEPEKAAKCDGDLLDVLDSIEFVTIIVEIETEFDIEIDDNDYELENMNTLPKMAELVEKYLAA